jgi:cytochrome c oxidase assembly factor CtaG
VPTLYEAALGNRALHDAEHASFVLGGTLVWIVLLDPRHAVSPARRLLVLVVIYAVGEALAYALTLSFHAYYPTYAAQDERLFGLTPLLDQKLAGVVMMIEQTVTLGFCALWLVFEHRRQRRRVESRAQPLQSDRKQGRLA